MPTDTFPLSAAQWELWLAQQLQPNTPIAVAQYTDLYGPLDCELLQWCFQLAGAELQSPHLRFAIVGGHPQQYVDRRHGGGFGYLDMTDRADPEQACTEWIAEHGHAGIDVLDGVIHTSMLFKLGRDRHRWYGRSHHIALDGLGAARLLQRTAELYSAAATGRPVPPARALPLQQIVEFDRDYRSSARWAADREYWGKQLADLDQSTRLVERYAPPSSRPRTVSAAVDVETMARLDAMPSVHGVGPAEVLVATLIGFLAQMTGRADIAVSLPVAARPTGALRRSAGMTANVVPIRVRDVTSRTVAELLQQVRMTMIGALRHQLYRQEDMRRDQGLGAAGRTGFGPLINVLSFPEAIAFGAARAQTHLLSIGPIEDLAVNCYRFGNGPLTIDLQANPDVYGAEELEQHQRGFMRYLHRFLSASDDEFAVHISADERAALHAPHAAPARLLPDLLTAGVGTGAIALTGNGRQLTYSELDELSSRWARELIGHGAGPESVVAVALPRSIESDVALWAVAKAGAVFFPVDPNDPPARVQKLLDDSGARLGITETGWRPGLSESVRWLLVDTDEFTSAVSRRSPAPVTDGDRIVPLRPDHPAYLIYTSGSSGEPKGVLTTHTGLGTLTDDIIARYRIRPESLVLQTHSPYCDASFLEYLGAFAAGAVLVVLAPEIVAGEELARTVQRYSVTHLLLTPAILATIDPAQVPSLLAVVVGGEHCPASLADQWATRTAMFNAYGPTEATVIVSQTEALTPGSEITIGRPLPGVQATVLDAGLRPVPPGARGELYLGGDALARGYLGRAPATAGRFVANPHGPRGSRLYRTGDVVHERDDGTLVFIGRSDVQMSLHGKRIEPSEVERALAADSTISQAVVRVWHSDRLGDRLIGYVVMADGAELDRNAVLTRLRSVLPSVMIPATLIPIAEVPINGSAGKVDRSALPEPQAQRPQFRAPASYVQRVVTELVGDLTGEPRVGLDDNFFELGGNSLLGVDLCNRLSDKLGTRVALSWLFTPTVQSLADTIEQALSGEVASDDSALRPILTLRGTGSGAPLICVHSAVPLSWCYAGLLPHITDRPVYGLQSPAIAGAPHQFSSVDELADRYLHELTRVQPTGPYYLLGWSLGGQIAHALGVRLRARGEEVRLLVMLDSVAFAEGSPSPQEPTVRDLVTHLRGNEQETPDTTALTLDEAVELLHREAGPSRALTREQLERLHRGYRECVAMSPRYRPGQFDGDLLYFSASQGITAELSSQMWRPYVRGQITEHRVAATHAQMLNRDVLATLGPILAAALADHP
ncbi:amino acid adenylation domain-containing protein [Skermania sp. ID1734]|uniref:non-ribosomal peptide synthetase n=1 Tax=Skermania sp. ID1734 TaxID=2597516 RepID=UPI00117F3A66|nr:non-ribosomal peptide synthetase [Skermania sp. ID1734]TSD95139.1 amino acid adenylation domain-containing protein [Skermania sp. ID1734]